MNENAIAVLLAVLQILGFVYLTVTIGVLVTSMVAAVIVLGALAGLKVLSCSSR